MAKKVAKVTKKSDPKYIGCTVKDLPRARRQEAAKFAIEVNPANAPMMAMVTALELTPLDLAVLTGKYWGTAGVNLSVSFLDQSTPDSLATRILTHMNAWGEFSNVKFSRTQRTGDVRISRDRGGYWSYLGTDIRMIPSDQPTMNLQGFTMSTPESEFRRVVRHETGHTLGCPHEQQRREIVERIDIGKALRYFRENQGWGESQTRSNVLTPLDERSITGSTDADDTSIMCYSLPGSIMKDGRQVPGGADFSTVDRSFGARLYPRVVEPPTDRPELNVTRLGRYVWQSE